MVPTIESLIIPRKSQNTLADNGKSLLAGVATQLLLPILRLFKNGRIILSDVLGEVFKPGS